ncbi:hypothetical protein Clacol_005804 [Clathrus columnatus]|uniref:F-box domain-containing protein n=1 Tax=Clathrus columnatus TaxID=1419009 RepID=A0AAV5AEF4_9AGAM|nr:hypothetical protein Clacol_005804 [Clathrus columnatus]
MEKLYSLLFGNEFALSVIGVPPPFEGSIIYDVSRPFKPALPVELIQHIIYLTALRSKPREKSRYDLLTISKSTRKLVFPVFFDTLELIGIERMISFVEIFVPESFFNKRNAQSHLITSTLKRLALVDKAPGNVQMSGLIIPTNLLDTIFFAPDHICVEIVQGCIGQRPDSEENHRLEQMNTSDTKDRPYPLPNLSVLIIEMSFVRRNIHPNPPLRTTLASIPDPQNRLFVRVSPYNTALPVDGMEGRVIGLTSNTTAISSRPSSSFTRDVWDVTDCIDWRTCDWDEAYIKERTGDNAL